MTWIGHLDLDAFFARCEEIKNPDLKGKPVVVCVYTRGGSSGAVSTSNYRARELGIGSGMPLSEAKTRSNDETVFLPVDREYYSRRSQEVMSVLRKNSGKIQKNSVDEAFFQLRKNPVEKARKIKEEVESKGFSCSIGLSDNKFVAKMASEHDKPDGLKKVEDKIDFLREKPVGEIHGVGSKTEEKLQEIGVERCEDLRQMNNARLATALGRNQAAELREKAAGKGSAELETEQQKQMSKITTMNEDSSDHSFVEKELSRACYRLHKRIEEEEKAFSSVEVIVIDTELNSFTRSKKVKTSRTREKLFGHASSLLEEFMSEKDAEVRRVGVRVSGLVDTGKQTSLVSF